MRIERLSINSFGHFYGAEFGPFQNRITILYGPNEAGKTTLLAFLQAVLFGFPRRTDPLWRPALNGGSLSGRIVLADVAGQQLTIERKEGTRGGPVTLLSADGTELDADHLARLLGNASRDTFQNVFAFGLDQLTSINSLHSNEISSQIYGASLGTQKLPSALSALERQAGEIFRPSGRTQTVYHLLEQLEAIEEQLREQGDDSETYSKLQADLATFNREAAELREFSNQLRSERTQIDAVLDAANAVQEARVQLAEHVGNAPDTDENVIRSRETILQETEGVNARLGVLRQQLDDEERHLSRSGTPANVPLVSLLLLLVAGVALIAGIVAGGAGLVVGIGVALLLGSLAIVRWLGHQRRMSAHVTRTQRVERMHTEYRRERDRLWTLLGQVGVGVGDDIAADLVEQRKALESAGHARRSHNDRTAWFRQQVTEREVALADVCAGLESGPAVDLEQRVSAIDTELVQIDARRATNDQQIGETRAAIRRLEAGTSATAALRTQQEYLLEELRVAADTWSGYMLAREILTRSQKRFEEEQQPAVIQTASRYLRTITAGRYDRIMVSLDNKDIRVVQPNGASKSDTELSRGTREQLYLSLRFGYITGFGCTSARLPVIVDDILVNFDPTRARATARAFTELSQTNQILVFTCHPSTVEHFQSVSDDVQVVELS